MKIEDAGLALASAIGELGTVDEKVQSLNAVREALHAVSPFASEPVDFVRWVPIGNVEANDYNPNSVAPPEMELLRLSIEADGYTQPIVAFAKADDQHEVVDGFHRNLIARRDEGIRERVHGYLPLAVINASRTEKGDRIASTVRHNRARGQHGVSGMSDLILELKRRNWSDKKIGKNLGMEPDEVLRLSQITGLAEMFADRDFSQAWEAQIPEPAEEAIDGND